MSLFKVGIKESEYITETMDPFDSLEEAIKAWNLLIKVLSKTELDNPAIFEDNYTALVNGYEIVIKEILTYKGS